MKNFAKIALTALLLAGTAAAVTTTPAEARVSVGIGIGGGGYYGPDYGPSPYCDRYSRFYDPYRCDAQYDDDYYYDPIFFDGAWITGPYRYRYYGGHPEFFIHGGWHSDVRFGNGGFHPGGHGGGGGNWHGGGGGNWHGGGSHGGGGSWHGGGSHGGGGGGWHHH